LDSSAIAIRRKSITEVEQKERAEGGCWARLRRSSSIEAAVSATFERRAAAAPPQGVIGQNRRAMTRALATVVACLVAPAGALADDPLAGFDYGAAHVHRPPQRQTPAEVRAALEGARPDITACLDRNGFVGTVRVSARLETSGALVVTVSPRPASEAVRACGELEAQRRLANLAVVRTVRATITVRRRAAARAPAPPAPPTDELAFEGPVHASLDGDRAGLLQCLATSAPGVLGRATLHLTLQPDGTLLLSSASLPTGLPAEPALPCLSRRIEALRFAPAPARPLEIDHTIELAP
jgi:hypothetical protein